jgi:hypothetical protein
MTSSGVMLWVGLGSGSDVEGSGSGSGDVVASGSGSGSGSDVVVGILVATQEAQLDGSTHAESPPEPTHWENVVVDSQELPEEDSIPVRVKVGRSISSGAEVEVENVVGSDVESSELVVGTRELVGDGKSVCVSSDMSVSG